MPDTEKSEPDEAVEPDHDGLLARLDVIEQQPLGDRAQAYNTLHAELSRRLESADTDV